MSTTTILTSLLLLLLLPFIAASALEHDKSILLRIKSHWNNPPSLASWSDSSTSPCSWYGITCSTTAAVTNITIRSRHIDGDIPSFICDLTNLTVLDLYDNSICGPLPRSLSNCTNLLHLDLSQNSINGSIPGTIGGLVALRELLLDRNYFTSFPVEIGKLVNLETLTLAHNSFTPTPLPLEFAGLTKLTYLWASNANLVGELPEWLGSFRQLEHLDLSSNQLVGTIPESVWSLSSLRIMYLYNNSLSGGIPAKIGTLGLVRIDISGNQLNGSLPEDLGLLQNLEILHVSNNSFTGAIPRSISRIASLYDIRLFGNQLTGTLPPDLGKYSRLSNLEITWNRITGELPETLCENGQLGYIAAYSNQLTGKVPESLGSCLSLISIQFQGNRLSGEFPSAIWSLPNLTTLVLNGNSLSGELPEKLSWNLTRVGISGNRFSGRIPSSATQLEVFQASSNAFSGELPANFSGMASLQELLLDGNAVSGEIPASVGELRKLTFLNLSWNRLTGGIPDTIGSLHVLNYLDLSMNQLSGQIPPSFDNLKLNSLNLSFNSLTGPIPTSLQIAAYDQSFLGNPGLCSAANAPLLTLPTCTVKSNSSRELPVSLLVLIAVLGAAAALAVTVFVVRNLRRKTQTWDVIKWNLTPFQHLDFNEACIFNQLVPENRVGQGGSGEVYRVELGNRKRDVVAVKRIWKSRKLKEFLAEVELLGSIRHVNIVKLLCCLSSDADDCKLLVYEYLENGSLHEWLHANTRVGGLDWPTRVEIAVGAARGLCYLHHHCSPPIAHWDVKSSNILLDSDFKPKVADFGLARILAGGVGVATSVYTVVGSLGYMAPECAYKSRADEKVDVYSFGVVLLELTTGRQAHQRGRDCNLIQWTWTHSQNGKSLINAADENIKDPLWIEEITSVMRLALVCTGALPSNRPSMKDVLNVLLQCSSAYRSPMGDDGGEIEEEDLSLHEVGGDESVNKR